MYKILFPDRFRKGREIKKTLERKRSEEERKENEGLRRFDKAGDQARG